MLTYHQTLDRTVLYFEYALPEKPVKIAALSTTPEACRKFLAGTCLLGNKCRYYHAPVKPKAATPPSGKPHFSAPPGSAPVTDKNRTKAKGKYPPRQTFPVTSIDGRVLYLKSNIPMKLLTNGPSINPDDGWQNNTLLDNAEPSGYVRFSLNMFRVTDTDPAPPPDTPPNPPPELALPPGPSPPGHSPLRSPTRPSCNVASPLMLRPYVRSEHTQPASTPVVLGTQPTPVAPENATAWDTPRHQNISSSSYGTPMQEEVDAFTRTWAFLANDEVTSSTVFQGICRECSKYILQYYTVVHHRIHQQPLSANDFIIYVNRPAMPESSPPAPHLYLAIFCWVSPTTVVVPGPRS